MAVNWMIVKMTGRKSSPLLVVGSADSEFKTLKCFEYAFEYGDSGLLPFIRSGSHLSFKNFGKHFPFLQVIDRCQCTVRGSPDGEHPLL